MNTILLIMIVIALFGVAIFIYFSAIVLKASRRVSNLWHASNPGEKIIFYENGAYCASFPGELNIIRGNGLLVLTENAIHFVLWAPLKFLRIPLENILYLDIVKKFAGRWGRLPMLHIKYRSEFFEEFETAWAISNAGKWIEKIELLKSNPQK